MATLFVIALSFAMVLIVLGLASSAQSYIDYYPSTISFNVHESAPPGHNRTHEMKLEHIISHLHLKVKLDEHGRPIHDEACAANHTKQQVRYAVCNQTFHGLSLLDYALLSLASYFEPDDPQLPVLLNEFFPPWADPPLKWRMHGSTQSMPARIKWTEVELPELGMVVISVRGTDPAQLGNFLEDIRLWTEPVALGILATVFPTIRVWPRDTVEMVILGVHDLLELFGLPDDMWSYVELVKHIDSTIAPETKLVLTGHSLGGGMAAVISALLHRPMVAIQPPGVYWSLAKHQRQLFKGKNRQHEFSTELEHHWMHHESVTIVVEHDWVNHIFDAHGGLVQMLECERKEQSLLVSCHMLEGTICHLMKRCGDYRHRWHSCVHDFDPHGSVSSGIKTIAEEAYDKVSHSTEGVIKLPTKETLLDAPMQWKAWLVHYTQRHAPYAVALLAVFFLVFPTELIERFLVL